jgi:hypothetical protein
MRRWLLLGVHKELSTSNPNFSKAEIRIEIQIYRFNCYRCVRVPGVRYLINCLKSNSEIPSLPKFPSKRRFKRSRGSELTIKSEQFIFLQFLSDQVAFQGQWPPFLESLRRQLRIDTKGLPQFCNFFFFFCIVASIVCMCRWGHECLPIEVRSFCETGVGDNISWQIIFLRIYTFSKPLK